MSWAGKGYCGCCGRETAAAEWCADCATHVLAAGKPWDRTWYAQHREDCPFAAKAWGEKAEPSTPQEPA